MKKSLVKFLAASAILVSSYSNASIISNADVSALTVTMPASWTFLNSGALLNGVTVNVTSDNSERFVGLRNSGAALSAANPFIIDMRLSSTQVITGFSFFNDWGQQLGQQVMTMRVEVFSAGSAFYSTLFSSLSLNTFGEIGLDSGLLLSGADRITFSILGLQSTNFEIREFVITTQEAQQVVVSAPSAGIAALLLGGVLLTRRRFK